MSPKAYLWRNTSGHEMIPSFSQYVSASRDFTTELLTITTNLIKCIGLGYPLLLPHWKLRWSDDTSLSRELPV